MTTTTADQNTHAHTQAGEEIHRPESSQSYFRPELIRGNSPPSPTTGGSPLTPLSPSTSHTPVEKDCNHLARVKSEDKKGMDWNIHCTCCKGPICSLARRVSRDGMSSSHSPLSPALEDGPSESRPGSHEESHVHADDRLTEGKGKVCKDCVGCDQKEVVKQW